MKNPQNIPEEAIFLGRVGFIGFIGFLLGFPSLRGMGLRTGGYGSQELVWVGVGVTGLTRLKV